MKRLLLYLTLISAAAAPAAAMDFAGSDILVPIVGRTPGAFGSQWQTDLVITNAGRGVATPVLIVFIRRDQPDQSLARSIEARSSLVLRDVVLETFGHEHAAGIVKIETFDDQAKISARARIYNTGSPTGQYGQTVQGLPVLKLSRETYLPGLSGAGGNRTNVGIANPAGTEARVFIALFTEEGALRGGYATIVPPRSVLQVNDVFSQFPAGPLDGATVQINSSHGVYAYASIVRSDTGDADFVIGTGVLIGDAE